MSDATIDDLSFFMIDILFFVKMISVKKKEEKDNIRKTRFITKTHS